MESWDVGFTVVAETFDRVSRPCRQASFIAISSSTSNFPNSSLLSLSPPIRSRIENLDFLLVS